MKYYAIGKSYDLGYSDKAASDRLSDKSGNEIFETKKAAQATARSYIKAAMHYPFKYTQNRSADGMHYLARNFDLGMGCVVDIVEA